eukprot:COSAG05_NODE_21235_length_273_cov_0.885057_1_plen_44_part_01
MYIVQLHSFICLTDDDGALALALARWRGRPARRSARSPPPESLW